MDGVARLLQSLELSAENIAAATRLSVERVQAIIEGAPADLSELRALSQGLRLPMRAFALGRRTADGEGELSVLFRSAAQRGPRQQQSTVDFVAGFVEAAIRILPNRARPPEWLGEMRPVEQTSLEAHRLADRFRDVFLPTQLDAPLTDLPALLNDKAEIIVGGLRLSRYEGASVVVGGYGFAFVSPRFPGRMLFTLAHELGHIIAHHRQGEPAIFDSSTQIAAWKQRSINERFVDTFASALLLPTRGVARALKAIRTALNATSDSVGDIELLYLARFFGVSFEVAARRCEQLKLLPQGGATALAEALKKEFGSPEKRADVLGLPPRPEIRIPKVSDRLLLYVVDRIEAGRVSAGWAAERFGLTIGDLFDAHGRIARERRR
ncbi:ImmA/IrrE family metallo-endopeptidase [Siccirubricoccus phaeus]|uniref:ImmA/IrrE family metallo-endopeptidase n=1 Tax=Siccirubricoccus phaeus TaxID=2595053 RepID=UPI0011F1F556|nr:ImmA/IrrE family metallo-endopeptidase [Siccirubricoccus phaeus]